MILQRGCGKIWERLSVSGQFPFFRPASTLQRFNDFTTRACGDTAGWTAPARERFRSWSHGEATERLGNRESM
jgi:hypothetical protein